MGVVSPLGHLQQTKTRYGGGIVFDQFVFVATILLMVLLASGPVSSWIGRAKVVVIVQGEQQDQKERWWWWR